LNVSDIISKTALSNNIKPSYAYLKDEVKSLKVDEKYGIYGLEKDIISTISELESSGKTLLDFSIYIDPSTSSRSLSSSDSTSFGSYEGYLMRQSFYVYNTQTQYTTTNQDRVRGWINGAINFGMAFATKWIGVPYAILTSLPQGITTSGPLLNNLVQQEVTDRRILIYDKDGKMALNQYIVAYRDYALAVRQTYTLYPSSPYSTSYTSSHGPVPVYPPYWSDNATVREKTYNYYMWGNLSTVPKYNLGGEFTHR